MCDTHTYVKLNFASSPLMQYDQAHELKHLQPSFCWNMRIHDRAGRLTCRSRQPGVNEIKEVAVVSNAPFLRFWLSPHGMAVIQICRRNPQQQRQDHALRMFCLGSQVSPKSCNRYAVQIVGLPSPHHAISVKAVTGFPPTMSRLAKYHNDQRRLQSREFRQD